MLICTIVLDNYLMWFNNRSEDRIIHWRNFRKSLTNWPNDLQSVTDIWSKAPRVNHYLCYNDIAIWPNPWTLISDNLYCDLAVSLGMFYTLYLSDYEHKDSMYLQGFKLKNSHKYYNLLFCEQGKYVLNFDIDKVVNNLMLTDTAESVYYITLKDLKI